MRRSIGRALALSGGLATIACNPSTSRPAFRPFPEARIDTVIGSPDSTILRIADAVRAEGLSVRRLSERDGFLETDGYDVDRQQPGGVRTTHPDRTVILRFWADPAYASNAPGGSHALRTHTQITSEVVYHRTVDPSLTPRQTENPAGPDHPGTALIERVLARILPADTSGGR